MAQPLFRRSWGLSLPLPGAKTIISMARQARYQNLLGLNPRTESRSLIWCRRFSVRPNCLGLLYRKNCFEKTLEPGIYSFWDFRSELELFLIPRSDQFFIVTNQEVLTKDNIALRFSYIVNYRITDGPKLLTYVDPAQMGYIEGLASMIQTLIHPPTQIYWRSAISGINSLELNEQWEAFIPSIPYELQESAQKFGVTIEAMKLRDITFPKNIQTLFALQLEAKIRGQTDLENARTAVATARALKNASQLIGDDQNIRFLQYLETLIKIASSGNHTFVVGSEKITSDS
ncbi:slipin family protein [Synechocystis sp. CACIAM 05]|uniref:slipin family protein n=1 Tax=Synechocystis sp. CACIAM 05 TaxID=1933929 RepID=UPI001F29D826|nr:slipin family protein [Synechocystis sp. CACIAM 05]